MAEENKIAESGKQVALEYTGTLTDGSVFDSSEGKQPLKFVVGKGQVIPGFDKAVEGMKLDEEKTFTLKPEDAYGNVDPRLVHEFPTDKLPAEPAPEVGMMLMLQSPDGRQIPARIAEIKDKSVMIDLNPPLAGKELTFKVKVVEISEPEECKESDCGSCGCGC
ncbi:peptidylprolyl isomerase [Candidatus Woesearchaeota archaeon]|jgi:peptidylprolyl isomerase|nr:peptidylprolyl isomerase [Candidatus Woesearchaeota archaeon]